MMETWERQRPRRRKCQFCKRRRDCRHGPAPFLFHNFDEIEWVWLCGECFFIRREGLHLSDDDLEKDEA